MTISESIGKQVRGDGIIISTVAIHAMNWYGDYETAVSFNDGDSWRIAEGYDTLDEALDGHEKYKVMSYSELRDLKYIG